MANTNTKATKAATPATQAATPAPASTVYVVGKPPRITGHTATKNGNGGTAGTWAAIVAHMQANGGTITHTALKAVCAANGDPGFAGYATGKQRMWLVPQA